MDKQNKESNQDFISVMDSVTRMDSTTFSKTLDEEKKKMLALKKQFPNNPLFNQMENEDFDISQEDFVDMCKLILNGNMSDTLSNAFKFMNNDNKVEGNESKDNDIEG